MCYSTEIQTFSPTKHTLSICFCIVASFLFLSLKKASFMFSRAYVRALYLAKAKERRVKSMPAPTTRRRPAGFIDDGVGGREAHII